MGRPYRRETASIEDYSPIRGTSVISLNAFRDKLCSSFTKQFPDAEITINERRSAILEIRILFTPDVFMESYVNAITGKKSFALVANTKRIWGYDNYRYWHHHPIENPQSHVPCNEPSLKRILHEVQTVLTKIKCLDKDRS